MRARQPIPEALTRLAGLQSGVVSREQVLGTGFGPAGLTRLVRSGTWVRVASGVYLTAAVPISWAALAWSGVLIGGDVSRLGGRAAAFLYDLMPTPPGQIEVLVPAGRAAPKVSGVWYVRRHWLTTALQARKTTPGRILRAARSRHFLRQRALLEEVLLDVRAGVRSPIELDYLRDVERAHGLPVGERQVGRRNTEVDVLDEDFGLLVELVGRLGHTGMGRFRDMRRDNCATTDGLATLRYGKADVFGSPCEVAQEVSANLARLGWQGMPQRCDRCRRVA